MDQNTEKKFEIKINYFYFSNKIEENFYLSLFFLLIPFLVIMIDIYQA